MIIWPACQRGPDGYVAQTRDNPQPADSVLTATACNMTVRHKAFLTCFTLETMMRRDDFLKMLAGAAAVGAWPLSAQAATNLKMMIPANPGGGWDTTGRALGPALQAAGAGAVAYENKGGAAGAIGLA